MPTEQRAPVSPEARRGRRASCAIPIQQLLKEEAEDALAAASRRPRDKSNAHPFHLATFVHEKLTSARSTVATVKQRLRSTVIPSRHAAASESALDRNKPAALIGLSALFIVALVLIFLVSGADDSPPLIIDSTGPIPSAVAPTPPPIPTTQAAAEPARVAHPEKKDHSAGSAHSSKGASAGASGAQSANKVANDLARQWFGVSAGGR